jgi:hypothetical protein
MTYFRATFVGNDCSEQLKKVHFRGVSPVETAEC